MSVINPSALGEKFDTAFQAKLNACQNPEEIKELMHTQELSRGLITLDWDQSFRIPVETPEPTSFTKTVTIGSLKYNLEAENAEGLANAEIALYRQVFKPAAATAEPVRDPVTGQFRTTVDQPAAATPITEEERNNLQIQFQLGQISAAEYIEKSGAVASYLEKQGVPVAELKAQVEERQQVRTESDWRAATEQFLQHSDWPGGDVNRQRLGETIMALGLVDSPSVESLQRAYEVLKAKNMLAETPESAAQKLTAEREAIIAKAQTPQEIRDALHHGSAAIWDR